MASKHSDWTQSSLRLGGVPLPSNSVSSNTLNHTPAPSSSLPRPPGPHKSPPTNRPPQAERPRYDNGSPPEQAMKPTPISLWPVIYIAVTLPLVITLVFNWDPLGRVVDVEAAKKRASLENATLTFEMEKTEREKEVMTHERELWINARESYAHVPHGAFWDVISPTPSCLGYGKREYSAVLRNIPEGWDLIDACAYMPAEIKGVKLRHPSRCVEAIGFPHSEVYGYWIVDWDQPDCKPWFRDFEDKWCTGYNSGKRRIEAEIVGISKRDWDWQPLCHTTPLVWDMVTYPKPVRCEERLWGKRVAMWDIPDESCLS